jgi:hypothetical protein
MLQVVYILNIRVTITQGTKENAEMIFRIRNNASIIGGDKNRAKKNI